MRLTDLVTPLKPLEAMASGKVLIASDVGGHRELVRDGQTGFLFPAGDAAALARAIARTLDERADWSRVRAEARRFVEVERSWKRSVAGYAPVYESARLERSRAGRARRRTPGANEDSPRLPPFPLPADERREDTRLPHGSAPVVVP
jgi:hypothetical protein